MIPVKHMLTTTNCFICNYLIVTIHFLFSDGQRALFGRISTLEEAVQRHYNAFISTAASSSSVRLSVRTPSDRSILEGLPAKTVETLEAWAARVNSSRENLEDAVSILMYVLSS